MMHLYVLGVLDEEGSIPMSRLAEVLDVSLSSTTGIVTRMEERGLVERTHVREDRRVVLVGLTSAGREMAASIESAGRDHLAGVLGELTPGRARARPRGGTPFRRGDAAARRRLARAAARGRRPSCLSNP